MLRDRFRSRCSSSPSDRTCPVFFRPQRTTIVHEEDQDRRALAFFWWLRGTSALAAGPALMIGDMIGRER